jgi:EmrB/QacA subfamily drug resistance transporter
MHGRPATQELGEARVSHPHRWQILGVLITALLVTSIDHTIINVALPSLVEDLGASAAQLQWIVASYTIVFAGLLLTAGSLGDRFGRRPALLAGLTTFLFGSVLAALAGSSGMLIAARGIMGLGGALIMPTTLSVLVNVFGDPKERAKAIAAWTAAAGIGIALGPIVGGFLMRSFSWSSVFWINVPLLLVALVGARHLVPDSRDPNATRLDPVGAGLSTVAVGSSVYGIIEAPTSGWLSPTTGGAFVVATLTGAMFAAWEMRRAEPMLDLRLFRNPAFSAASAALTLLFFAMAGAVFLQAQYLQFILGYTPLAAGFALVPAAAGMLVGTGGGAHLAQNHGGRIAVAAGTLFATAGLAVQAGFVDGTSYVPTGVGLFLFGLGAGIAMAPATELIMATLPASRAGVGSAVNDTVRELGGALGVAVIGSVAASRYTSSVQSDLDRFPDVDARTRAVLGDNLGAALHATGHLGSDAAGVAALARDAFVDSMTSSLWIAVGMAAVATAVALAFLPRRTARSAAAGHAHRVDHRHMALAAVLVAVVALTTLGCASNDSPDASARPTTTASPSPTVPAPTSSGVQRPTTARDELVPVAGGQLHIRCAGEGDTTIVLIAGFEANTDIWNAVTPDLQSKARVCAYDRFGTGTSSSPPSDQTFATQAENLHTLLEAAGEPGPYIVVGHSFGGAEAVTFASMHTSEVVGLLLLDASPATWPDTACGVVNDGSEVAASFQTTCAMFEPDGNAERLDAHAAFDLVAQIDSLDDLPVVVAPAAERAYTGLAEAEAARLRAAWDAGQAHWASLSTTAEIVAVANTGHNIQVDQPAQVVALVGGLLP